MNTFFKVNLLSSCGYFNFILPIIIYYHSKFEQLCYKGLTLKLPALIGVYTIFCRSLHRVLLEFTPPFIGVDAICIRRLSTFFRSFSSPSWLRSESEKSFVPYTFKDKMGSEIVEKRIQFFANYSQRRKNSGHATLLYISIIVFYCSLLFNNTIITIFSYSNYHNF